MSHARSKTKTATLSIRIAPEIKAAAEAAAKYERRSITSLIEVLVIRHCDALGLTQRSKEKDGKS